MIETLKLRLSLGSTNAPSLPNGSTKPDVGDQPQGELNHARVTRDIGQRSPSRTRKQAIDQAPYQESVAARELRIFYNRNKLCNSFKKVLSSSAGLFIVLLLYMCLGAVLFQQFERVEETKARRNLNQERLKMVTKIENCTDTSCIVDEVKEWEMLILDKYPVFYIIGDDPVWTFENAFYFCFTTISTIGYGTITPRTGIGRMSCIFYAIVGIPLMLLFIADVGTALARWAKICAIAFKQNRKRTTAFKEAAKASLRRHLKPQKNNSSPEVENDNVDAINGKQPENASACEAPSLHTVNETEEAVGRDEFWVKMHLPKRSLSMTTQDSQSFDNDDGPGSHSSEDESDASEGSSHCSTGTESKNGSLDTLKIGDSNIEGTEMEPEGDVFYVENDTSVLATEEDRHSSEMQDILGDLTHKSSMEGPNSSCKGTANCHSERSSVQSDCMDPTQARKPSPMMRRQSSRVGFGDVIDLQSGKRTSIQNRRVLPSANSGDDERSSLGGGEIIENPLVETDEEGEADKLLKPKGFSFSASPRRNAVFIPGSDTSPSSPPTSPDMGGRKSQSNAPSRRRSSITRRMGMAFGSISAVSDREVAHFSFPAWLALILLIIYLLFGAGVVSQMDQWGFVDSFYFSFISLSTIGFGDLTPKKSWIFSFLYTFLGMCFTSMCMSLSSKELTRLLKKLAWKVGYYKSRQWKGSVRAFVKDKRRRIHERSEHWRGSRKQKNRKRKRPSGHRVGEKVSVRTQNASGVEQGQDHGGQATT